MMAIWRIFLSLSAATTLLCGSAYAASQPINTSSGKYAALVLDADTGDVFFEKNADLKRYPASLTKMMTLYLAFDALKSGRLKLTTPLPVSKHAAKQPQTNIGLKAGQTIRVQEAIKALVVRSANDVAVVMAEALGKTEWNFAIKMTSTARSLGMSKTQFRNAHGLPDRQQFTTARDMAKLSMALRRDFPQYYHYFTTKEFNWKGRTYTSHNRVLDKFDGVDGIKTGYISMSGFNLASSVKRDGYHLVGVVMGGQSSRARDAHMVSLLDKSFRAIAKRADEPRAFAGAPVPKPRPGSIQSATPTALPWIKVSFNSKGDDASKQAAPTESVISEQADAEPKQIEGTKSGSFFRFVPEPQKQVVPEPNSLNFQLASLKSQEKLRGKWGIQVGAFRDEKAALKAASKAVTIARRELKYSKINITDKGQSTASIHRARLANLTESQAKRACQALSQKSTPCFVFKLDQQNL